MADEIKYDFGTPKLSRLLGIWGIAAAIGLGASHFSNKSQYNVAYNEAVECFNQTEGDTVPGINNVFELANFYKAVSGKGPKVTSVSYDNGTFVGAKVEENLTRNQLESFADSACGTGLEAH